MSYEHPVYTPVRRRPAPPARAEHRVLAYAGAYHGWGFHEDGCLAGVRAAAALGRDLVTAAALYAAPDHPRPVRAPVRRAFRYRSYMWLVDTGELPRLPRVAAAAGLVPVPRPPGRPGGRIRANVAAYLCRHGIDLGGGQVLMLGHARVLGHVFNPLTVYWCHRADGTLAASSPRCTTPTGSGTPTCSARRRRPG